MARQKHGHRPLVLLLCLLGCVLAQGEFIDETGTTNTPGDDPLRPSKATPHCTKQQLLQCSEFLLLSIYSCWRPLPAVSNTPTKCKVTQLCLVKQVQ